MNYDKQIIDKQLQDYYSNKKQKGYYTTTEVMKMTGISERTLRYRIKEVYNKYNGVPSLLSKQDRSWRIHYTIVDEFQSSYTPRITTLYNYNWHSFITWNMKDRYNEAYHQQLINEVREAFPNNEFYSVIEKTKKGVNHVHIVSDAPLDKLTIKIDAILNNYIDKNSYLLEVKPIIKKSQAVNYLKK